MFEKEAKKWVKENTRIEHSASFGEIWVEPSAEKGFIAGAEFGYNKANEWHDINNIEPSKGQLGKQLLIRMESVIGDTDYDYLVYKYKGESITDVAGVLAWKEIE